MRYSQRGPLARDVTKEYSMGTPILWVQCAGTYRGPWLLWVRRSTAERPSPLRVCRYLYNNKLTGSVPSSLSALTELVFLCVPRSCLRRLRVRPRRVGWVVSAPSVRQVGGMHVGDVERGRCGVRPIPVVSEGTLARDVTKEYSRGTPSYGNAARVPCRGTWLLRVRRSTPSGRVRFGCAATSARMC
jgi:hypothetical protein